MKKFLSLALALILVLTMVPALADDTKSTEVSLKLDAWISEIYDWSVPDEIKINYYPDENRYYSYGNKIEFTNVYLYENHYIAVYSAGNVEYIDLYPTTDLDYDRYDEVEEELKVTVRLQFDGFGYRRDEGTAECTFSFWGDPITIDPSYFKFESYILPADGVVEFGGTVTLFSEISTVNNESHH